MTVLHSEPSQPSSASFVRKDRRCPMRNFLIAVAATCLFTPPACLFTPQAVAKTDQDVSGTSQPAPSAADHGRKALTVKGGTLLNSNPTPEEAKKTAEATNRQILEKRRHKR